MITMPAVRPGALVAPVTPTRPDAPATAGNSNSFSSTLTKAMQEVNDLQNASQNQQRAFILGQTNDIHSVMIATQKASVALELTTQVRNKVLEAYQEVMKMTM
jgi:flagellar hook-basal body complex protein FliE